MKMKLKMNDVDYCVEILQDRNNYWLLGKKVPSI